MNIRKVVGIAFVAMVLVSSRCSATIFSSKTGGTKQGVFNGSIKKLQDVQQTFIKNVNRPKPHYAALFKKWDGYLASLRGLIQSEKKESRVRKTCSDQISCTYELLAEKSKWLFTHVTHTKNQGVFEQMKKNSAELYRAQGSIMNVRDKNATEIKKALLAVLDLTIKMYGKVIGSATELDKNFQIRGGAI